MNNDSWLAGWTWLHNQPSQWWGKRTYFYLCRKYAHERQTINFIIIKIIVLYTSVVKTLFYIWKWERGSEREWQSHCIPIESGKTLSKELKSFLFTTLRFRQVLASMSQILLMACLPFHNLLIPLCWFPLLIII